MIRIGIIGCNYGRLVQLPAFRRESRCSVVAIAGSEAVKAAAIAQASNIQHSFGNWRELVEHPEIDAVVIGVPPSLQPAIAIRSLQMGKPVFAEKPIAADRASAEAMVAAASASNLANMVDFSFCAIPAWSKAKELLEEGAIGRIRHVVVSWHVENYAARMRLRSWKTSAEQGGGALGNFVSHTFHYLEWMCGPIARLSAHLSGLPDAPDIETNASINLDFQSGASGSIVMSCAAYLGSGHRVEIYGENGTISLVNATPDYMRGFVLRLARRPAEFSLIEVEDSVDPRFPEDGRIAPVSRLASRFLDSIESGRPAEPGFAEGLRTQVLLDAARSSYSTGNWTDMRAQNRGASA